MPELIPSAVIAALIAALVSLITARSDRLRERPNAVNSLRHEKEVWYLEQLSGYLLELWFQTDALEQDSSSEKIREKWDEKYNQALQCLGQSAPFLNYLDLSGRSLSETAETGEASETEDAAGSQYDPALHCTCGVHFYAAENRLGVFEEFPKCNSGNAGSTKKHVKSLYLRAAEFLDICMMKRHSVLESADDSTSEQFEILGNQYIGVAGIACCDKEFSLREKYKKFVNCAYCRMRYCEKGKKGSRRANRRAAWRKWREDELPFVGCYNTRCPYDS